MLEVRVLKVKGLSELEVFDLASRLEGLKFKGLRVIFCQGFVANTCLQDLVVELGLESELCSEGLGGYWARPRHWTCRGGAGGPSLST